jgi:FMN phosphatase YigB (HAD superfamily)
LLDAFGTILTCDFTEHTRELPVLAGIPAKAMYDEFARIAPALTDGRLFDDVLPFMAGLRARGIKIAIVSNCDEQARGLLGSLGVTPLADALVLSCEVGAAKPSARIFQRALEALGINAVQIVRGDAGTEVPAGGTTMVRSLAEVEAMLSACRAGRVHRGRP